MLVFSNTIDLEYLDKPSNIGNNIGGILAPFLSLVGSILVYIAFKVQFKANQDIKEQFKKQNDDQHYFRLIDSLDKRITLYSFNVGKEQYSGYNVLSYFTNKIDKNINAKMIFFSKRMFLNCPEVFSDLDFEVIFDHVSSREVFPTYTKFKEDYLKADYHERYRIFAFHSDSEESLSATLKELIITKFYSLPISNVRGFYQNVLAELIKENSSFFDGYFKTLNLIMDHIDKMENSEFYISFLKGNLTTSEKIIILLYVGSYNNNTDLEKKIYKHEIVNSLINVKGVKIGNITEEDYKEHIQKLLTRV